MSKFTLRLQPSEAAVVTAAAQIYAAYIAAGVNTLETDEDLVEKSTQAAIEIARRTDQVIRSEGEMA